MQWRAGQPRSAALAAGDYRLAERGIGHRRRNAIRLLDQRGDDVRLGNCLDDLALDEDLALAVAGCDTQVGFASLPWAVDDTAHDGHPQRHAHALKALGDLIGERVDVNLGPSATGAGDDLELPLAQVQRLQDLQADLHLFNRRSTERNTDGVADALREQDAERRGRLDGALERGAGLGDAEVQRPVTLLRQHPVRLHHDDRVIVLDRDLEVVEVVLLEQARLPDRALDQGLGSRLAVLLQQARLQRAGIHPDADARAGGFRSRRDLADLVVELPDVPGVHSHRADARVDGGEDITRLEVDVGDDRDLTLRGEDVQDIRVILVRDRHPHDVATGCCQLGNLLKCRIDVGGLRRRHRLNAHLRVATDTDLAHLDLAGLATGGENGGNFRESEIYCSHDASLLRPAERSVGARQARPVSTSSTRFRGHRLGLDPLPRSPVGLDKLAWSR